MLIPITIQLISLNVKPSSHTKGFFIQAYQFHRSLPSSHLTSSHPISSYRGFMQIKVLLVYRKLRFFHTSIPTLSLLPSSHSIPSHPTSSHLLNFHMQIMVCSYKSHTKSSSCKLRFFHTSLHMSSYHLLMQSFLLIRVYCSFHPHLIFSISFHSTHHVHLILSIPSIPSFVPSFLIQLLCLLCM